MQIYLPTKLNPQGWLSDMLLPQLYSENADAKKLRDKFYGGESGIKQKVISLHPEWRNTLVQGLQKISNAPGKTPENIEIDKRYIKFMRNLQPHHIAAMQPYIQIFLKTKRFRSKKGSWAGGDTKAIVFKPFADIGLLSAKESGGIFSGGNESDILKNKFMRGEGAGIEGMTVKRDFPVWGLAASFEVDIDFFFSSFPMFVGGHPVGGPTTGATDGNSLKADDYLKLIAPDLDNEVETLNLEYGWKINNKGDSSFWGVTKDVLELVEREERKSFRINWQRHDITFSETGEVKLKVKYYGLPENLAYRMPKVKKKSDVLKPLDLNLLKNLTADKNLIEAYEQLAAHEKDVKDLSEKCLSPIDPETNKARAPEELADIKKRLPKAKEEIKKLSVAIEKMKRGFANKTSSLFLEAIRQKNKLFQVRFKSYRKDAPAPEDKVGKKKNYAPFNGKSKHTIEASFYEVPPKDPEFPGKTFLEQTTNYLEKNITKVKSTYTVEKALQESKNKLTWHKIAVDSKSKTEKQLDRILGALTYSNFGAGDPISVSEKYIKTKDLPPNGPGCGPLFKVAPHADQPGNGRLKCVPVGVPIKGEARPPWKHYGNFMFFALRDLIATMQKFSNTGKSGDNPWDRYPIVSLGNIVYRPMGKEVTINIGDILIEVGVFQRWFYNSVIAKGAKSWTFGQFIQSVMEELVPVALGGHSLASGGGLLSPIVHTPFQISKGYVRAELHDHPTDKIYKEGHDAWLEFLKYQAELKSSSESKNDQSVIHFHQRVTTQVIDTGFNTPMLKRVANRNFNRDKDEAEGLFHLFIGNSKGLLETISFSYTDNPDLRAALIFDKFKDIAFPYLKFAYSANPILTGNNLFYKGGFFVLPVSPLGIAIEKDPGITGYYSIQNLVDQFSIGTYKTVINGINVYSPALFKKERAFRKKQIQCGVDEAKEKGPTEIPIFSTYGIDEYIHKDFINDPKVGGVYKLRQKTKKERLAEATAAPVEAGPGTGVAGQPMG